MAENSSSVLDVSKVTVAGASTVLHTAGRYKKAWRAMAPATADVWYNPTGAVCGPNLAGCFLAKAGTEFGSRPDVVENTAVTYFCATAGLIIPCVLWF